MGSYLDDAERVINELAARSQKKKMQKAAEEAAKFEKERAKQRSKRGQLF